MVNRRPRAVHHQPATLSLTLPHQPQLLNPEAEVDNANRQTLSPKPYTLRCTPHTQTLSHKLEDASPKPRALTRECNPEILNPKTPNPKPQTLNPSVEAGKGGLGWGLRWRTQCCQQRTRINETERQKLRPARGVFALRKKRRPPRCADSTLKLKGKI